MFCPGEGHWHATFFVLVWGCVEGEVVHGRVSSVDCSCLFGVRRRDGGTPVPHALLVPCIHGISVWRQYPCTSAAHVPHLFVRKATVCAFMQTHPATVPFLRRLVGISRVRTGTWRWMRRTPCARTVLLGFRQLRTQRRNGQKGTATTPAYRPPVYRLPRRRLFRRTRRAGRRVGGAAAE